MIGKGQASDTRVSPHPPPRLGGQPRRNQIQNDSSTKPMTTLSRPKNRI
jgi:hypothetical protein